MYLKMIDLGLYSMYFLKYSIRYGKKLGWDFYGPRIFFRKLLWFISENRTLFQLAIFTVILFLNVLIPILIFFYFKYNKF